MVVRDRRNTSLLILITDPEQSIRPIDITLGRSLEDAPGCDRKQNVTNACACVERVNNKQGQNDMPHQLLTFQNS